MKKILTVLSDLLARILMPFGYGWPTPADFKNNADSALWRITLATKKGWLRWNKYSQTGARPYYAAILPDGTPMILRSDGKVFGMELAHTDYSLECWFEHDNKMEFKCSVSEGKSDGPQFTGQRSLKELFDTVYKHSF